MTKLFNQRGAIDLILVLVVMIAALGFGGYVYTQQRQAQHGYDAAGSGITVAKHQKTKKVPTAMADTTAGWIAFTSSTGKFSLKYPPKWVTPTNKDLCNANLFDRTIYLGPTAETVLHCASEYFGMISVSSVDGDHRSDYAFDASTYGNITKSSVTIGKFTGERAAAIVTKVPDGPVTMKVGDRAIRYTFLANGITYVATYSQQAGNPDVSADFDTMVKSTLKFN